MEQTYTLTLTEEDLRLLLDAMDSAADWFTEWVTDGWVDGEDADVLTDRAEILATASEQLNEHLNAKAG